MNTALLDLKPAAATAALVRAQGRKSLLITADVGSRDSALKAVREVTDKWGALDILVCNAGITRDAVLWKMTEDEWDDVLTTNLKGCFNFIQAAAPVMRGQKGGRIVCVSSINGMRGKFGQANYAASKAGVIALVKTAARELGRFGVTVNAVAPGLIMTAMMHAIPAEAKAAALNETALGRLGEPGDVAHVVNFLCSDLARHITGEVIKVDGGQYI